jgi:hypothetical protein
VEGTSSTSKKSVVDRMGKLAKHTKNSIGRGQEGTLISFRNCSPSVQEFALHEHSPPQWDPDWSTVRFASSNSIVPYFVVYAIGRVFSRGWP